MKNNLEIERRFIVDSTLAGPRLADLESVQITQGYLTQPTDSLVVRVRAERSIRDDERKHTLCIKKFISQGVCIEEEEEITEKKFDSYILLCNGNSLDKVRYLYPYRGRIFEIDEFFSVSKGKLLLAEVELPSLDERVDLPSFIGREITHEKGLSNMNMAFNYEAVYSRINRLRGL